MSKLIRKQLRAQLLFLLLFVVTFTSIPISMQVVAAASCPTPSTYGAKAEGMISIYKIPKMSTNCKPLNEQYLLNQLNIGESIVVYGNPTEVSGNEKDRQTGQYRYLGWDASGSVYRNWKFPPDSSVTGSVAKNWVKAPWDTAEGKRRNIRESTIYTRNPDAPSWLARMVDPYNKPSSSTNFITSYNALKGASWTADTLLDYAIIQQKPTDFTPGVVQMWSQWTDGSWWYEIFLIRPMVTPNPNVVVETIDLEVTKVVHPDAVYVDQATTINVTVKNKGNKNSGSFVVGLFGISPEPTKPVTNIAPGAETLVTFSTKFATSGLKKLSAKADFNGQITETDKTNNIKAFQIMVNKLNEPTTPMAIISHVEGDHRTDPEISIKPAADPKLDDKLSYSPGKEAITLYEWKYKTPSGSTIQKKPVAKDFATEGKYVIELRVTNSAKKVSEWAQLVINVADKATPNPSASPTPTPEPTPTPKPDLVAKIEFQPATIIAGEKSNLVNRSKGLTSYTWSFSENLSRVLPNQSDFEFYDQTYSEPGNYKADISVTDGEGTQKATAMLRVIDPKPVAVVSGISRVIQGRPLERPYNLLNSYTPLEDRGVKIDFTRSEMRYKKVGDPTYTAGWFTTTPSELGNYSIEGKVYDTTGRVSEWDAMIMEVVPDAPPMVEIIAPAESYRENGFMLYMDAESPDGDLLKHLLLEERYDRNGNGNFDEEAWTILYDGDFKSTHAVNYTSVGQRQYRATVTEDYGMKGISEIAMTDILNYAPGVNFNVFGITQQPGQGEDSAPPVTSYAPESILRSWSLKRPYVKGNGDKLGWKADASSLSTKNAVLASFAVGYPNSGLGANSRTKFQLASDIAGKPAWRLQTGGTLIPQIFAGNRVYSYLVDTSRAGQPYIFSEHDSLTGAINRTFEVISNNQFIAFKNIGPDETFYFSDRTDYSSDIHQVKVIATDNKGNLKDQYDFRRSPESQNATGAGLNYLEISPDGEFMYVGYREAYNVIDTWTQYDVEQRFYKYSLKGKYLVWEAPGERMYNGFYTDIQMTLATDGSAYFTYHYQDRNAYRLSSYVGYLTKINASGLKKSYKFASSAGLSAAVVADDNTRVYVSSVYVDWEGKRAIPSLYTFATNNEVLNYINSYPLADIDASGAHSWNDVAMYPNPLIFENTGVYVHNRIAAYNYLFDKHGNLSARYNYNLLPANTGKMFITAAGDIVYPTLMQIGLTSWTDSSAPKDIRASLYSVNHAVNLAQTPQTVFDAGAWNTAVGQSTPILPDGSLYVFYEQFVMPFVSASGAVGALKPIDANTVEIMNDDWGGLLYDSGSTMKNYALEFNVSVNHIDNAKKVGAAIQIQDERNMYAAEWSKDTLTLYRVVNGVKTALQSAPLARSAYTTYPFKLEASNGLLRVFVNHSKVIEVTDTTFLKGTAGLLSLGQPNASFSAVKKLNYGDMYTEEKYEAVLVNDPIVYDKLFSDVESDPRSTEEWSYAHNPNIFENPEGLSAYNGKTYGVTLNSLDKPGVYEISYRAQDNPGLSAYSKWSEPITKLLYVHRRPIALPDVRFTGQVYAEGEALDYETYDTSYDPDTPQRLLDKVFRTRWADETTWTTGKRNFYSRPGVELIVQEQVKDLHGAWSYWAEQVIYKAALPPVNQTKPVMTITYPGGTSAAAPTVLVKEPTITWTYFDQENDPQEQYRLSLNYVDNNEIALYIDYAGAEKNFKLMEGLINPGRVVKVQGQVYSKGAWSNLSNIRYFVLDLPPETHLLSYNGIDAANPIYTIINRPQLRVFTVDPENHPITAIDYEVYRVSDGVKVVDTETAVSAANYTTPVLTDGLYYWRARANDGFLWGPFSSNGYFFIDTVKPADVEEQLEVEPTAVTVKFNAFSDAAPSSGHASRTFYLQKVNSNGSVTNIDLNQDGTTEYSIPISLQAKSYRVTGLVAGQEYRLTVLDYDVAGNEGHYAYIHFSTNRAPTADFDWSPQPVYEGDKVTIASNVNDEDGDPLSVTYELTSSTGVKRSFSYTLTRSGTVYPKTGPVLQLLDVGNWSVKQTVSDGIADPIIVTKTIAVLPLGITAEVVHTDDWEANRLRWNNVKPKELRSPSTFWAGERFVLKSRTTDTGTSTTKATKVEVAAARVGSTSLGSSDQKAWSGFIGAEQAQVKLESLKDGDYVFTFKATYSNGVVKETDVTIQIKDSWTSFFEFHKSW